MSPRLLNVPASGTTTKSSGLAVLAAIAESRIREDMKMPETQGHQTQCMSDYVSNDAVAGCSSVKDSTISDFSIKVTSVSETGIAGTKRKGYQCSQRSEAFQLLTDMEQHTRNVHTVKHHKKYHDFDNTLENNGPLDTHSYRKQGDSEKEHKCDQCDSVFRLLWQLNRHTRGVHTTELRKTCHDCGITFKHKESLDKHRKAKHSGQETKKQECNQCGKTFPYAKNLKRHISTTHTINPRVICPDCGKTYKHKDSLDKHRLDKHNDHGKKYKCDQCHKKFTYITYLQRHQVTHTGKRNYECPVCHKFFASTSSRNNHKRSLHEGKEKPFAYKERLNRLRLRNQPENSQNTSCPEKNITCQIYKKKVSSQYALKKHQKIHDKGDLVCERCSKTFKNKNKLNHHKCMSVNGNNYDCLTYNTSFASRKGLKSHTTWKHTDLQAKGNPENKQL